jgi:hypothetical protein
MPHFLDVHPPNENRQERTAKQTRADTLKVDVDQFSRQV